MMYIIAPNIESYVKACERIGEYSKDALWVYQHGHLFGVDIRTEDTIVTYNLNYFDKAVLNQIERSIGLRIPYGDSPEYISLDDQNIEEPLEIKQYVIPTLGKALELEEDKWWRHHD